MVDALREIIEPLQPTGGMSALPLFAWRAIYTTNYDQLVERAFAAQGRALSVVRSDYDYPAIDQTTDTILYKIHGCITQDRSLGHRASLVLSESDYTAPSTYRQSVFDHLALDIFGAGVLIIGQSLKDKHLSDIVRLAAGRQDAYGYRNKVKLLSFETDPNLALIYEHQNVQIAFGGLDEFMDELLSVQPVANTGNDSEKRTEVVLPAELLAATIDVAAELERRPRIDAMHSGRPATYAEIRAGYTFARDVENELTTRFSVGRRVLPIVGVAGVGKTTAARRFLFGRHEHGAHTWEHKQGFRLRPEAWSEVHHSLQNNGERGFLLLDDVTSEQRFANQLVELLRGGSPDDTTGLFVVTTAEMSQWAPRQKSAEFFRHGEPLRMGRLSSPEAESLLRLLRDVEEIRNLASPSFRAKTPAKQKKDLIRRSQGDVFVSLKTLFSSESLDRILLREYAGIEEGPREIYRVVSALEAAGLLVHRQMVLRLLSVPISYLSAYLESLEGLIEEYDDRSSEGIYVWQTRHRRIAEIISKYKFSDPEERVRLLHKVVEHVNPSVQLERRFVGDLCNSDYGIRGLPNPEDRIDLYEMLVKIDPTHRIPRHRLISELLNRGELELAAVTIADAEEAVGSDPPIQRYKVLLTLEQSRQEELLPEDRRALLRVAKQDAERGIQSFKDNKYQYFVYNDVAVEWFTVTGSAEWLNESVKLLRRAYESLLDPHIREEAESAERILRQSTPKKRERSRRS